MIKKEIQHILLDKNLSLRKLADNMGINHQNLWNKLSRETIKYTEVETILKYLGYKIQIVPENN
jgi:DNA-binding Xre family transcriptional regulator